MLIQSPIELSIRLAMRAPFQRRFNAYGGRLDPCDHGADNRPDKRGVSNPRTGLGTATRQKQGGCSRPGSTVDGDRRQHARGKNRRASGVASRRDNLHDANHLAAAHGHHMSARKELLGISDGPIRGGQPPRFVAALLAASAVHNQGRTRGRDPAAFGWSRRESVTAKIRP